MKLCLMKQETLDTLKASLQNTYTKYYTEETNKWIYEVCGDEPFQEFREIPDFDLVPLNSGLSSGEMDLENCKIIYENLSFLTESQASDERLWAGLTHSVFYDYMRKRFGYAEGPVPNVKASGKIHSQFFYKGGIRAGFFRNRISKCWWIGKCTYDKSRANPFEKLDAIGSADLVTKVSEIFKSNNFSSNPTILNGIVKCFEYFNNEQIKILTKEHLRPCLQTLNAIGGNIILDALTEDEIAEIMIQKILQLRIGNKNDITFSDFDEEDDENEILEQDDSSEVAEKTYVKETVVFEDEEIEEGNIEESTAFENSITEVVVIDEIAEFEESDGNENNTVELEELDEETLILLGLSDKPVIRVGCTFDVINDETGEMKSFKADYHKGKLPEFINEVLGRRIDDCVEFHGSKYRISKIMI